MAKALTKDESVSADQAFLQNVVADGSRPEATAPTGDIPAVTAPSGVLIPQTSADELADYAGSGMENVTGRDVQIPRITILQSLSPQIRATNSEYINGAKEGMICDTAMREFWPSIDFVPAYYDKVWLEWAPRATKKGLIAIHADASILEAAKKDNKGAWKIGDNTVQETARFFGFNVTGNWSRCFIPMAGTQLKRSRRILTLASGEKLTTSSGIRFTPPLWHRAYTLGTVSESNADGDWFSWTVERGETLLQIFGVQATEIRKEILAFIDTIKNSADDITRNRMAEEGAANG